MNSLSKLYHWKNLLAGILIVTAGILLSQGLSLYLNKRERTKNQILYLQQIRNDFQNHKKDVVSIFNINNKIVTLIDSLLGTPGANPPNTVLLRIMNTQPYDCSILAYKNILQSSDLSDEALKLKIAKHVAGFEGWARWKLQSIDWQWDKTARPYIYERSLIQKSDFQKNPLTDPVFRNVLFDRRMFAHDVELITPEMVASIDSITNSIDQLLKKIE